MELYSWLWEFFIGVAPVLTQICNRPDTMPTDPYSYDMTCQMLTGSFSDNITPSGNPLFMQYNMEDGTHWKEIVTEIGKMDNKPTIIFVDEADRGCEGTGNLFILEELAKALKMNFVYGAEFLEWKDEDNNVCTTGNGILSKYPLKNAQVMQFEHQCCWFSHRLGGRNAVFAEATIDGVDVQLTAAHLESGTALKDQLECIAVKTMQATEITRLGQKFKGTHFVSGDFNSPFLDFGGPVGAFTLAGFTDAFEKIPFWKRTTDPTDHGFCLDYMLSDDNCLINPTIRKEFGTLSDHWPLSTELDMQCFTKKHQQ